MSALKTLPGRDWKVELETAGTGTPLLYLHGAFGMEWSRPLIAALSAHCTVIAPHMPGYGQSEGLDDIDSFYDLSVWLDEVLDLLDMDRIALAGHDFGGTAAAEYAALFRRRIDRLALLAPLGLWLDEAPTPDMFGLTPGALTKELFADPQSEAAMAFNARDPDRERQNEAILRRRQALIAAAKLLWPLPDKGLKNRLYRIAAPTLLVHGTQDRMTPQAHADAFHAAIAGSTLAGVEAGHMLPQEAPAETAAAVRAFLSGDSA